MSNQPKESMLPDGTPAIMLSPAQMAILVEMIEEREWMTGFRKRLQVWTRYATVGGTILIGLSLWWPWINKTVSLFLGGIPS